jgi:BioD-like phosphotransacetylase family protein
MQAEHMIRYIQAQTLIITPGDRSDNIQAALREHQAGGGETLPVSGLILTGDFRPDSALAEQIRRSHLPVIAVKEDTYTTASKIINTVFKILPEDRERIEWAIRLVVEHVDVGAIAEALGG